MPDSADYVAVERRWLEEVAIPAVLDRQRPFTKPEKCTEDSDGEEG